MTGKRKIILSAVAAVAALIVSDGHAEKAAWTLERCVEEALARNPLILSSIDQHEAALARVNQAGALPQPGLDFDFDLQPKLFDFRGSGESYYGVSQLLEFPGKRRLRRTIAVREAQEVRADSDLLKLDVALQVKEAFYGLLLATENLRLARQNLELTRDFLEKTEWKHAEGAVARVDVLRARVEDLKAANDVKTAENEVRLARAALNVILSRDRNAPLDIQEGHRPNGADLPPLEAFQNRALSQRPEILRLRLAMDRESMKKTQGYMEYLPDFEIGLSRHRITGEKTTWDFTLSLPIPLFFWQPRRGEVAEAEALVRSLQKEMGYTEMIVGLEVEEAYSRAATAVDQIRLFEEDILAEAEEAYHMFLFSYQEGEIGGMELIDARRTLIDVRQSYAEALHNYGLTLSLLERAAGLLTDSIGDNND
jgi:outer membrane protein, heavy metal efflux system